MRRLPDNKIVPYISSDGEMLIAVTRIDVITVLNNIAANPLKSPLNKAGKQPKKNVVHDHPTKPSLRFPLSSRINIFVAMITPVICVSMIKLYAIN